MLIEAAKSGQLSEVRDILTWRKDATDINCYDEDVSFCFFLFILICVANQNRSLRH